MHYQAAQSCLKLLKQSRGVIRRDWTTDLSWQGVAIEFSIRVHDAFEAEPPELSEIEELGRRLGL